MIYIKSWHELGGGALSNALNYKFPISKGGNL